MSWGLGTSIDCGWYDPCLPGGGDELAWLVRVPDEREQAVRRDAFMEACPLVQLARVGDRAQGTVPLPYGQQTITRNTWRALLDELGAPGGGQPPP